MKADTNDNILVVSQKGYGKRSNLDDYRITNRGGKGVKTLNITDKTGNLVAIKNVNDSNDLVIINQSGITIRLAIKDVRVQGRATQGVKLIDLTKRNDTIASVCKVDSDPEQAAEEEAKTDLAEEAGAINELTADSDIFSELQDENHDSDSNIEADDIVEDIEEDSDNNM